MAAKIDDRVVSISFENKQFQANVTATLSSLDKLNSAIKNLSKSGDGFGNLEKSSNKVNFLGISTAFDKLKAKFGKGLPEADQAFSDVEKGSNKVGFLGIGTAWDKVKAKFTGGAPEVDQTFSDMEKSSNKVQFQGISTAFDKLKGKFGHGVPEADQAFSDVEKASNKAQLTGASSAVDKLRGYFGKGFPEADQAFSGVERASEKVDFNGMTRALDGLTNRFSVLQGAAAVALGNIASQAAIRGKNFVKAFTFGPITQGFHEYETQLNAIQTILSNTQASGAKLKDVNAALSELNTYADKTIYNFTEMTKNIGTFTAAGVDLKTATGSIKGIANLAALSGSNSQQASTAMYQLSQAISAGRVSLQDWNSVVNAGMGGTIFQRALAQTAVAMGEIDGKALKLTGKMKNVTINGESFRNSIMAKPGEQSWLSGKVLTNTLQQLSGDLSKAQLKAQGFSNAQIKAIQAQAKMAVDAATKVKSFSQLMDTTKEAIGSGWARTWQLVFGDFGEAKNLFTNLSNAITGFVSKSAHARNSILKDWKDLGGRAFLIDTLKLAFKELGDILRPIKQAFRDIFPKTTAADLLHMTTSFRKLVEQFKIGPETANNLRRTFRGFFAVLDIGKQLIGGVVEAIKTLFGEAKKGSGGFLSFTGGIGDMLVALDEWIKKGQFITKFFHFLGQALSFPIKLFGKLKDAISGVFEGASGANGDDISGTIDKITKGAKPLESILVNLAKAWYNLSGVIYAAVSPAVKGLVGLFKDLGGAISSAISQNNFDNVVKVLQTSLLGGIFLAIKKAVGSGFEVGLKTPLESIKGSMDALTGSLKNMQTLIKAAAIEKIAISVALLAASAVALSLVKPDRLASAMTAIAAGFGELVGTMALVSKVGKFTLGAPIVAAGFVLLAGAMVILAGAIAILSRLSWEELGKGMAGVAGGLTLMVVATRGLAKAGPSLIPAGIGLMAVSAALIIMAGAMKIFATMKWEQLAKGLAGVAGALVAIGLASKLMGPGLILIGPGLMAVGAALVIISAAVGIMGAMKLETIGKGILAIAGSLAAIALAIRAMPLTTPIIAAGLVLVGVALNEIAAAIAVAGNLNWTTIGKGLLVVGASLAILAVGLKLMTFALPGAAALLVAASAFAIFTPTLAVMGNMKFTTILKGLAGMALSIAVLGTVGAIAGPALILLGLGIAGIGLGVYAVGKGVQMLAKAVILLGEDGAKGVGVLVAAFTAMIAVIPKVILDFVKGLVGIGGEIVKLLPAVATTLGKITIMFIDVLIKAIPKVAEAIGKLIMAVVGIINQNSGPLIAAGFKLMMNLLTGIANNIGPITTTVSTIIVRFLNALSGKIGQIVNAGTNLLVKFLEGLVKNMDKIVSAVAKLIVKFTGAVANKLGDIITAGAKLLAKFIEGIGKNASDLAVSAAKMVGKFFQAAVKAALTLINAGADAVINFIHGVADTIRKKSKELANAAADLGEAIIEGVATGLIGLPIMLAEKLLSPFKAVYNSIKEWISSSGASELKGAVIAGLDAVFNEAEAYGRQRAKELRKVVRGVGNPFVYELTEGAKAALGVWPPLAQQVSAQFGNAIVNESPKFQAIGNFIMYDMLKGLTGSGPEINAAFSTVNLKLQDAVDTYGSILDEAIKKKHTALVETTKAQALIDKLNEKEGKPSKKDQDRIDAQQKIIDAQNKISENQKKIIDKNRVLFNEASGDQKFLKNYLTDGKQMLLGLAKAYNEADKALSKAEDQLAKLRDMQKSTADQFNATPEIAKQDSEGADISGKDQFTNYLAALATQKEAVTTYNQTLDELRAMGLDEKTYQKLLAEGTGGQAFADAIKAGGADAIAQLTSLDSAIGAQADDIGKDNAERFYQIGLDSTAALVNSLKANMKTIEAVMAEIGDKMIKALKKKLKIKSPSKEMAKLGAFSGKGLAEGMRATSRVVTAAAEDVGGDAITALRDSMKQAFNDHIDVDPTITPILDLSQIKKHASKLDSLTGVTPISVATGRDQALSISASRLELSAEAAENLEVAKVFKFEQNNYSPTALSESEIYRKTNNQLSQAKSALGLTQ